MHAHLLKKVYNGFERKRESKTDLLFYPLRYLRHQNIGANLVLTRLEREREREGAFTELKLVSFIDRKINIR